MARPPGEPALPGRSFGVKKDSWEVNCQCICTTPAAATKAFALTPQASALPQVTVRGCRSAGSSGATTPAKKLAGTSSEPVLVR